MKSSVMFLGLALLSLVVMSEAKAGQVVTFNNCSGGKSRGEVVGRAINGTLVRLANGAVVTVKIDANGNSYTYGQLNQVCR